MSKPALNEIVMQNIRDYAIFMLDPSGFVTTWNEGAENLKGYTESEAIGKHFSIFFTPEDQQIGKPEYERGMAEAHGRFEGEGWRVRKDGSQFWGNEIINAIRDDHGKLVGFTKIARDLTERKRMEDALRESEERHRLLVENIRDYAVFTLCPAGRVTSWNPGAQRVFGYSEEEIVGSSAAVLFTPEDREAGEHTKELATALVEGRASDDRWQLRKDGTRFWASGVTTGMHDAAGGLRGYAKVCRDLTEHKQVEEQRERLLAQEKIARLEAERAMTIRDEFLAIVSHELRTPLTIILLWTKMLRAGSVKPEDMSQVIDTIAQTADAQRQLIEDLLDISSITSGKLRLTIKDADVSVLVSAAVEAVRPMAEAKGVHLEVASGGRTSQMRCDPDRIQQVLWNLLNNAIKFSDRGGHVSVQLNAVTGGVRIIVADRGRGITPDFLPNVFDLFRQGDASTTRAQGGLGLGLSICKKLVELHGGSITAASKGEGQGATFTVELPISDVPVEVDSLRMPNTGLINIAPSAPFTPGPVLNGTKVLLVEDEAHTRAAVQWLLVACGAKVTAVDSAAAALAAFRQSMNNGQFDVLISDIAMPGEDGYQLIGEIRTLERTIGRNIPAVALTAHARDMDRRRATDAGFQSHLSKPVEPQALVTAVVDLVNRRKAQPVRRTTAVPRN